MGGEADETSRVTPHIHFMRGWPQVDQLIREREYEDAISLCESLTNFDEGLKAEKLKEIKELFAYHLFSQGQYERAMGFFSELNTDPLQALAPFHTLARAHMGLTLAHVHRSGAWPVPQPVAQEPARQVPLPVRSALPWYVLVFLIQVR
jgi:hypothetical protein